MISRLLIPLGLIVAAVALFFALTQPMMRTLEVTQAAEADRQTALKNAAELKKIGGDLLGKYNAIPPEQKARLDTLVPNEPDNVQLIIDINNMASKYGMALRNIKVQTDEAATGTKLGPQSKKYGTIRLGFSVSGPYKALRLFLAELESSLRLIDVNTLSFTTSEKDANEYVFEIKTYWLKP